MIQNSDPDPSMFGALPPGAWWEVANGKRPNIQPHGSDASNRAVIAAQNGDLELQGVNFAYPTRYGLAGGSGLCWGCTAVGC
jgi:ATP-binding cassette subfamily B (MDR/TAP) protein 10